MLYMLRAARNSLLLRALFRGDYQGRRSKRKSRMHKVDCYTFALCEVRDV